ncbi:MAG: DUF362 domain-containing protein [Candidatus Sumerlaeota bacterium]|nr:DUF362 domain-containing protein [Candidatus Sumerlaeota bacterium]
MGKVSIVKTTQGIKKGLTHALDLIGGLGHYIKKNDKVLLKPNLNGVEGCTNRELVESLIQLLFDLNVQEVFMAEATFGDSRMTNMFFEKTGYAELAEKYGISLFNLNESEAVEVEVKNPLILDKLRIAREVYEADKIINLPNMKVHYATGITLALKNLKGLLVGDEKRHFHEVGLDKAIVDLNNTIKPHLNIVDCISCMEGMGPRGGDIVNLNLLMTGESPAEVDYIGSLIMGYSLDEVRHLKYCIDVNNIDPGRIEVVGEKIEDVRYTFKKVVLGNIIPGKFRIHEKNACSSCMNAFLLSCSFLEGGLADYADVYLGSLMDEKEATGDLKIAFGNCCPDDKRFNIRIKGCPPYPFVLKEHLREKLQKKSGDLEK